MKAILPNIIKAIFTAALTLSVAGAFAAEPNETGAGKVCGVLRSFEGETQVFDSTRTHLGDASFGTKLRCGDWVSVDKGKATIEHGAGSALLVGENTFFQILDPQSGENPEHAHWALYRGEFLAQSSGQEIRILTPNAMGRIEKGSAFVVYSTLTDESQAVGMGGKVTLENRFFGDRRMTADFAKVVVFGNPVERLLPDEGRFVNTKELNERLARLGVPGSVREGLEKAAKAGAKTKMPVTLATTSREKSAIKVGGEGELAANHTPVEHSPTKVARRAPASFMGKPKVLPKRRIVRDEPDFRLKRQPEEDSEKKRLLQALSTMQSESDE